MQKAKTKTVRMRRRSAVVAKAFGRWITLGMHMYLARARGKTLLVGVSEPLNSLPDVFAVEYPGKLELAKGPEDFLANHSHLIVAENVPTLRQAFRKAEAFARKWKRSRKVLEQCRCKEIKV